MWVELSLRLNVGGLNVKAPFEAHVYVLLGFHLNNTTVYSEQAMFCMWILHDKKQLDIPLKTHI